MFETNLAAINAARKQYGSDYRNFVSIEKIGHRQWSAQIKQPVIASGIALRTEYEGAYAFPKADPLAWLDKHIEEQKASAVLISDAAQASEDFSEDELEAEAARADAIANAQASEQALPNGKVWVHMSSIPKPTKQVWHIADEMKAANPQASRKEIQDECVRRGIASGTARTQYQAWKKANDSSRANEAAAIEASKRFNSK